jgi:hypothetical protein
VIADGRAEAALLFGSKAISTIEQYAKAEEYAAAMGALFTRVAAANPHAAAPAVLLTSVATARRLGVPEHRWMFLHGYADSRERDLMERADLSAGPASAMAVQHALEMAGVGADGLAAIDLYSCFPALLFNICGSTSFWTGGREEEVDPEDLAGSAGCPGGMQMDTAQSTPWRSGR